MSEAQCILGDYEAAPVQQEAGVRLAHVLSLPEPEAIASAHAADQDKTVLPPTTLDALAVRRIFETQSLTPEERIEQLLSEAWKSRTLVERSVPSELLPHITQDLAAWYRCSAQDISQVLEQPTYIQDIYDETELYADCPFLRNAAEINELSWMRDNGKDGMTLELSARMIVLEAMHASRSDLN